MHARTHTHMYMHAHTHMYMHAHTRAGTHTRGDTHTHIHINSRNQDTALNEDTLYTNNQSQKHVHLLAAYHTNTCPTQPDQTSFTLRWPNQTALTWSNNRTIYVIHQEAPTSPIISVQFFDATWLHVQVSHITSSSLIHTTIIQHTTTIELMQTSKEGNVLSSLWNHAHHKLFLI